MSKFGNLEQAEKNARLRDIENSKILSEEEMYLANELQAKASSRGMKLVPERKVKNKAKFAQFIQQNWDFLIENDYLTDEEMLFLLRIHRRVGFMSNCIIFDINQKDQIPMTQTDIANFLKTSKAKVSRIVNKLMDKGIVVKAQGMKEGVNARAYSLYVNPNIIYCGDRDNVSAPLKTMFVRVPKELKKLPVKLF